MSDSELQLLLYWMAHRLATEEATAAVVELLGFGGNRGLDYAERRKRALGILNSADVEKAKAREQIDGLHKNCVRILLTLTRSSEYWRAFNT